ncbi:hypothetical protein CEXT_612681 [Caerostris extrusa]|uniref:Uncharacterized protein n=1 Tax=Caerostris extrusa TaxID=172846 RepID=A0AAV4Q0W5_CAEEX|nr:hypothetical protein CEXT_612681 [Caerostris extrusa]
MYHLINRRSTTLPVQEGPEKQHARPLRFFLRFWIKRRSFHGVSPSKKRAQRDRGLEDRRSAFKFGKNENTIMLERTGTLCGAARIFELGLEEFWTNICV